MIKIEINPQYYDAYINRGVMKRKSGDAYGAISDYNKALKINSQDSDLYYNRGNAKNQIGDMKGACFDWSKASELGDEDAGKSVRNQCQ